MGTEIKANSLNIILPVGISFYTFQTLSYTIDIYRGKLEPTRDPIAFFAFVFHRSLKTENGFLACNEHSTSNFGVYP